MKFKYILLLITLAGILVNTNSFGQDDGFYILKEVDSLKNKLKQTAKTTKTIESKFKQEKFLSFLSEKVISHGIFYFKTPQKLRWEYLKPFNYLIIMNENNIIIKDEVKENKFDSKSNKMFKEINDILVGCVNGDLLSNKDNFKMTYFENSNQYLTLLIPFSKNISSFIKSINIYFDKKDLTVSKIKMIEPSGDYTIIHFYNKIINQGISDETFIIR